MKNHSVPTQITRVPARIHGFALVVALVLLLVMTMVAVIAMRSTTLDLKMTTNNAQSRRAFQASDSVRQTIEPLVASVAFFVNWPVAYGGSEPNTNFPQPLPANTILTVNAPTTTPAKSSLTLANIEDSANARSTTPDVQYKIDLNNDGVIDQYDMKSDVWITKTGILPGGPRIPGAGVGNYIFELYNIRSRGRSAGNAEVRTDADFRVYINAAAR